MIQCNRMLKYKILRVPQNLLEETARNHTNHKTNNAWLEIVFNEGHFTSSETYFGVILFYTSGTVEISRRSTV
jgi:hypothetical protein